MAKKELPGNVAQKFFGALYQKPQPLPTEEYDALVSRLVARVGTNVVAGDQALQSLLIKYVTHHATDLNQVKALGDSVAGIKQRAIEDVVRAFPNANLDELVKHAKSAGYDVQVLK